MTTLVPSFLDKFFILIGNKDYHKSLYELKFRQDPTTDYCP